MGVFYVILSAVLNGFLPLMITIVYESGGHFTNIMFYKGIFVVPAAWMLCRLRRISLRVTLRQNLSCMTIALFQFLTSVLLYSSYTMISTGMATTLHFMYPVFVMLLCVVLFRKHPHVREWMILALCVTGVILFCNVQTGKQNLSGIFVALLSGLVYSGYILTIDKSSAAGLSSLVFMFYVFLYNGLFSGSVSLLAGTLTGLSLSGWIAMAISALAAGIVAVAYQRGIVATGACTASILSVAEPMVSVLVGVFFLGEAFTLRSGFGTLCVVAAVVLSALNRGDED